MVSFHKTRDLNNKKQAMTTEASQLSKNRSFGSLSKKPFLIGRHGVNGQVKYNNNNYYYYYYYY